MLAAHTVDCEKATIYQPVIKSFIDKWELEFPENVLKNLLPLFVIYLTINNCKETVDDVQLMHAFDSVLFLLTGDLALQIDSDIQELWSAMLSRSHLSFLTEPDSDDEEDLNDEHESLNPELDQFYDDLHDPNSDLQDWLELDDSFEPEFYSIHGPAQSCPKLFFHNPPPLTSVIYIKSQKLTKNIRL